jgi:hypothetical protein
MFKFVVVLVLGFSIGYAVYHQNEVASAAKATARTLDNAQKVAPKVVEQIKQDQKELSR